MSKMTFLFLSALSFLFFLFFVNLEAEHTANETKNYLANWEDEIAKSLALEKRSDLLDKIMNQVAKNGVQVVRYKDLQNGKNRIDLNPTADSISCLFHFNVPVSLYGLPVVQLEYCQPTMGLVQKTLVSPLFLGFLFILLLLFFLLRRESWQQKMNSQVLQQKLVMHEELSRVSRQVAHDIRSPLSALLTLVQMKIFADSAPEAASLLERSAKRIQDIAEDLHARGKWSLNGQTSVVELLSSIEQVEKLLILQYPEQKVRHQFEGSDLSVKVPLRLEVWERVLQNILKNSFEAQKNFSDKEIIIRSRVHDKKLYLEFQDFGRGIPKEVLSQVGAEGFSFGKESGTGLGVSFVKTILESVQGTVTIESELQKGTLVCLLCPLVNFESKLIE